MIDAPRFDWNDDKYAAIVATREMESCRLHAESERLDREEREAQATQWNERHSDCRIAGLAGFVFAIVIITWLFFILLPTLPAH